MQVLIQICRKILKVKYHHLWDTILLLEKWFNAWDKTKSRYILNMVKDKSLLVLRLALIIPLTLPHLERRTQSLLQLWISVTKQILTEKDASNTRIKSLFMSPVQLTSCQNSSQKLLLNKSKA